MQRQSESIAAGASWWDAAATTEIRAAFVPDSRELISGNADKAAIALTQREQEILALIAAGKANQEIAQMLYIALGTVRVHVDAILQKRDVRDRTQAAVVAIQKNLIN